MIVTRDVELELFTLAIVVSAVGGHVFHCVNLVHVDFRNVIFRLNSDNLHLFALCNLNGVPTDSSAVKVQLILIEACSRGQVTAAPPVITLTSCFLMTLS